MSFAKNIYRSLTEPLWWLAWEDVWLHISRAAVLDLVSAPNNPQGKIYAKRAVEVLTSGWRFHVLAWR